VVPGVCLAYRLVSYRTPRARVQSVASHKGIEKNVLVSQSVSQVLSGGLKVFLQVQALFLVKVYLPGGVSRVKAS